MPELCQDIAWGKPPGRAEEAVARIPAGGAAAASALPFKMGLIAAVFRRCAFRAGKPLLHDHALVSIRARRPGKGGTRGGLSTDLMPENIVAADDPPAANRLRM